MATTGFPDGPETGEDSRVHNRTGDRGQRTSWRAPWPYSIFGRALLLVAVPSLMLVGLLAAFSLAQRRQADAQAWSLHTRDVLDTVQQLQAQLVDAQTGIRGYLIARDTSFLEPYHRAVRQLPGTLASLRQLTLDSREQRERGRQLERHVLTVLEHYEDALRGAASPERASAVVARGKALMDTIRADVATFREHERGLDRDRRAELARAEQQSFGVVMFGTGASLFTVLALGVWFQRGLRRRVGDLGETARRLTEGQQAAPIAWIDELSAVDTALRDLASTLSQQQRAVVGALADAVHLFSAAESSRAVLDIAVERTLALSGAGLALCTLDRDPDGPAQVAAASAAPSHPSAAPAPGSIFTWAGSSDVRQSGRPLMLSAEERRTRSVPPEVERVFGGGVWLGVPILDDRRTTIGVLQVVSPEGRTFRSEERDVVATLAQAASVALALERSRQRLERVNADLALTNRENELFIYSVSHDLRSPLVNLDGFSKELARTTEALRELLHGDEVPERLRERALPLIDADMTESVHFIRTAVGRLAGIIDGLLRLSRAGRVEYRTEVVALDRIVQRIVDAMHATLAEAHAEVRVETLPPVSGDALAMEQLFANLIGNAVAYARPGVPPLIEVAVADDLARTDEFTVIRVSDNGLGIPEAHFEKVFHPLQRVHPGVARGEGMGLAIVRRIVERHRGRVWIRSVLDAGTTFYVELPRQPEEAAPHAS